MEFHAQWFKTRVVT